MSIEQVYLDKAMARNSLILMKAYYVNNTLDATIKVRICNTNILFLI